MKIFVVSLKRSERRRQFMLEQLNKFNLDYEIFDAIDYQSVSENDIAQYRSKIDYWQTVRRSIVCATLSHYLVIKKIIDQNLNCALILEDDALLPINIKDILSDIERVIKKNEIISLYYAGFHPLKLSLIGQEIIKSGQLLFPVNIEDAGSAASYIVQKEAAKNIVRINMPFIGMTDSFDIFYKNGGFSSFRCLYPPPVKPKNFKSSIDYFKPQSKLGEILNFIDKYKIPVFYQLIAYRRELFQRSLRKYILVNDVSPIYEKIISPQAKISNGDGYVK